MASSSLVDGCGTATFLHKSNKELSLRDVILSQRRKGTMSGKPAAIKLGDLVTNAKGGKYFPISSEEGGPVVWQPAEWLRILWHPSAYNGEEARLPLCLEPREEACAELAALEKAVASQLSERSLDEPKLFGRRQTTSDVQERFVSCLKTSTRGNPFIKVKVLLDRVCLWDAEQRPLEEVRDLRNRMCKLRTELKQVWMMSGQRGLLIEVTDLMLRDEEPQRCPFWPRGKKPAETMRQ